MLHSFLTSAPRAGECLTSGIRRFNPSEKDPGKISPYKLP